MIVSPPLNTNVNRIADWVELFLLVENTRLSKSKIYSILQNNTVNVDEEDIDSVFLELERRVLLYGKNKPFEIDGTNIIPKAKWKNCPEYSLCLFYSTYGVGRTLKGSKRDMGTKLFEDITKYCLENYLSSFGFLFGFPSTLSFKDQLDLFANKINEKRIDDPNPHDKDRDVDLVICKQFDEIRNNSILIFVQCAAGKNWDDKKPVAIESYRRYFSFSNKAVVSSMAITQVVSIEEWNNACDDYGVIIDRARLYRIFSSKSNSLSKPLKNKIIKWFESRMN